MPSYDYVCDNDNCKHVFEQRQNMSDDSLKTCPECREDTLRRLIGKGGGVIFKGSGFYVNDYKKIKPPDIGKSI